MATNIFNKVMINAREYVIRKFDAKTGMKLARLVMSRMEPLIPILAKERDDKTTSAGVYQAVFTILGTLTDEDIDDLVDKCLRVCSIMLPAGPQPIIDETGHYGVEEVEYDMGLTLMLCYEAIKWGASDFFGENSSFSSLFKRLDG